MKIFFDFYIMKKKTSDLASNSSITQVQELEMYKIVIKDIQYLFNL